MTSSGRANWLSFRIVSLAMEAIGDITASAEVSRVEVDGEMFDSRIQGGVLVRVF
jgi:xanthine/uracil permease